MNDTEAQKRIGERVTAWLENSGAEPLNKSAATSFRATCKDQAQHNPDPFLRKRFA